MSNKRVIIFSRPPIRGKVKTRLAADIGETQALVVHQKLYARTLALVDRLGVNKKIYLSEIPQSDFPQNYILQKGDNLGERMAHALRQELQHWQKVILIGSDCLDLTVEDLENAFRELDHCEVVLGPAHDGGYYLVGMKSFIPEIFENISWGTDSVLRQTLAITRKLALRTRLLKTRQDIDTIEDLPANWNEF